MVIVFPDNTALINFAVIGRMDLLERLVGRNGSWCRTVSEECDDWSRKPNLADMRRAHDIFGEPLTPENPREHATVLRYRDMLRTPGQPRTQNLGEAETLAIIECRNIRALFVTDDQSVGRVAPPGSPKVVGTWELLRASHRRECVTADELWDYSRRLHEAERHTPPTGPFDRGAFNSWLRG
ncbi:hypothetical protein [Gordonia sp. (in: high G+C Gram-positive bacteria)]|jgi:predicted nucleic acid-binding protein|uniref:hypothetical protein n=1 Tax=Gordonia sp. (in: high G+C Gram-positive bacteria) TaxID=84139 RepID=UPI001D91AEDE|nr:hypothetical protein [Gordonia sp. (in: high G+C Gram-positive bacteria)]MCB1294868.1 hypothetical protein [Gordonia sp. (in: high G+C Gram-positive bacteria)]HMS74531.1 hypothetical protein [Gordonia sp. (in: high G+C Gram-positive bacteria)]